MLNTMLKRKHWWWSFKASLLNMRIIVSCPHITVGKPPPPRPGEMGWKNTRNFMIIKFEVYTYTGHFHHWGMKWGQRTQNHITNEFWLINRPGPGEMRSKNRVISCHNILMSTLNTSHFYYSEAWNEVETVWSTG